MEELVSIGKILSDTNRVNILALLYREGELCVCELCDTLQLSQPLVSRNLKMMRDAKMVDTLQKGKWVIYSLHPSKHLEALFEHFNDAIIQLPKVVCCDIKE